MLNLLKYGTYIYRSPLVYKRIWLQTNFTIHSKSTFSGKNNNLKWMALIGIGGGSILGVGYSLSSLKGTPTQITSAVAIEEKSWQLPDLPSVKASRKIVHENDNSGLEIWLYQYQTCPFCCKVRAFLDYFGVNYSLVEVNPVLRKEVSWSQWKKVPVVLVKHKDGVQQLNDSSMIISVLRTLLIDQGFDFSNIDKYYPIHPAVNQAGKTMLEVQNKYFIMYGEHISLEKTKEQYAEERKWRQWVDDVLVHMLSPNVYRTPSESLQAFNWFSEVGEWKQHFGFWERNLVIYVGAAAMYFIGKRLKSRYNLEKDVRISLYTECNRWAKYVKRKGCFAGGDSPDLSDLAVFGVLQAIEGCNAWKDVLDNTEIGPWFSRMKEGVQSHQGASIVTC